MWVRVGFCTHAPHALPPLIAMAGGQGAAADLPSLVYLTADTTPVSFDPLLAVGPNNSYNSPVSRNAEMLEWSSTWAPPLCAALGASCLLCRVACACTIRQGAHRHRSLCQCVLVVSARIRRA